MRPFAGLKILDFTSLIPGPMATLYFADWGADVVRIESPDREDLARVTPPFANGTSTTHAFLNRSKQSHCFDFKDSDQLAKLRTMVREYDVIIEQFRPGVMQRFGLDYPSLKIINPRLIYCSLTGYGQDGPLASRAGHDINYAALTGLAAMTGRRQDGPILHGDPVCDLAGSFHAVMGILTALHHRHQTGEGQYIDVSITDCSLMLSALGMQMQLAANFSPSWEQTLLNGGSFYGYYRTSDGRYLSVGGLELKFLRGFLEAIGCLDLANLDLTKADSQRQLRSRIQDAIGQKTWAVWRELFDKLDVCVEPVLTFDEIARHPHFLARQMFIDVPCEDGTNQRQLANPLRFSQLQPQYKHIGVTKGLDNQ